MLEAYGWPSSVSDEEILERLVTLNAERFAEEASGQVRWLRPEYQNPEGLTVQVSMGLTEDKAVVRELGKQAWPKTLPEQAQAVRQALSRLNRPVGTTDVAQAFVGARRDRVGEILETLAGLGQLMKLEDGRYSR